MIPSQEPTSAQVQQALDWYWTLAEPPITATQTEAFQQWLAQDERHGVAWTRIVALHDKWQQATIQDHKPVLAAVDELQSDPKLFRTAKHFADIKLHKHKGLLALLLASSSLLWALQSEWGRWLSADHRAALGKHKSLILEDGSTVVLASGSAINIDYDSTFRKITLEKGTVFVQVAKNPERPFVIISAHGTAQALGTAYEVRLTPEHTQVTVVESKVDVCLHSAKPAQRCQIVHENQRIRLNANQLLPIETVAALEDTAWVGGKIIAHDRPLVDVLDALKQYHAGFILYDRQDLADIHVSGVFTLDQPIQTLQLLQLTTPIAYQTHTQKLITIKRK